MNLKIRKYSIFYYYTEDFDFRFSTYIIINKNRFDVPNSYGLVILSNAPKNVITYFIVTVFIDRKIS